MCYYIDKYHVRPAHAQAALLPHIPYIAFAFYQGETQMGKITAIVCVDDSMGLMFNKRRQSKDSELRKWILTFLDGKKLFMDSYTHGQFSDEPQDHLVVSDSYISEMSDGDICFTEKNADALPAGCDYIVCRWNRRYPSDVKLTADPAAYSIELLAEIPGSSHEKMTIEHWRRKE